MKAKWLPALYHNEFVKLTAVTSDIDPKINTLAEVSV